MPSPPRIPHQDPLFFGFIKPSPVLKNLADIYYVRSYVVATPDSTITSFSSGKQVQKESGKSIEISSSSSGGSPEEEEVQDAQTRKMTQPIIHAASSSSLSSSSTTRTTTVGKLFDSTPTLTEQFSDSLVIESKVRPMFLQTYNQQWEKVSPGEMQIPTNMSVRQDELDSIAERLEISTKPISQTCIVLGVSGIGKSTFVEQFVRQEREKKECQVYRVHAMEHTTMLIHGFEAIGQQLGVPRNTKTQASGKKEQHTDDIDYAMAAAAHMAKLDTPWLLVIDNQGVEDYLEPFLTRLSATGSKGRIVIISGMAWRQYIGSVVELTGGANNAIAELFDHKKQDSWSQEQVAFAQLCDDVFTGNVGVAMAAKGYIDTLGMSYENFLAKFKQVKLVLQDKMGLQGLSPEQTKVFTMSCQHIRDSSPVLWQLLLCLTSLMDCLCYRPAFVQSLYDELANEMSVECDFQSDMQLLESLRFVQRDSEDNWVFPRTVRNLQIEKLYQENAMEWHFVKCCRVIIEHKNYFAGQSLWGRSQFMGKGGGEAHCLAALELLFGLASAESHAPNLLRSQRLVVTIEFLMNDVLQMSQNSYILMQFFKLKLIERFGIVRTTDALKLAADEGDSVSHNALDSAQKTLDFVKRLHNGEDHAEVVTCMNHMASMYLVFGALEDGLSQYEEMITLTKRVHGTENHPDVAYASSQAACVLQSLGRYQKSLVLHKKVLEIRREVYGTDEHPNVAVTMHVIGTVLVVLKRYREALTVHRSTLAIWRKIFDDDAHSEIASSLSAIGGVYQALRRYKEALASQRECLEVQKSVYGTDESLEIATTLANIAEVLRLLGDYKEAFSTIQEALSLRLKIHGTDVHVDVASSMSCIASILQSLGRYDEALYHQQKTLEQYCRIYGTEEHLDVAITRSYIAKLYDLLDRHEEALEECRQTLALRVKIHGTKVHLDVAATLSHMASVLQKLGRFEEALTLQYETLELFHEIYHTDCHPDYANTMSQINGVLEDLMEYEKALEGHRETLALWRKIYQTDEHPEVSTGIGEIANVLSSLGRDEEALTEYERSLSLERRIYGTDEHQEICLSLTNTAVTMRKLDMPPELHLALDRNAWMFLPTDHPDFEKRKARFEKRHAKAVQKIQKEITKHSNQASIPACKLRAQLSALDLLRESTFQLGHEEFSSIMVLYLKNSKKKAKNFYLNLANETTVMFIHSLMNAGAFQQASEVLLTYCARCKTTIEDAVKEVVLDSFAHKWFGTADKMLFAAGYLLLALTNQTDAMFCFNTCVEIAGSTFNSQRASQHCHFIAEALMKEGMIIEGMNFATREKELKVEGDGEEKDE